jgi:hypothetical protein
MDNNATWFEVFIALGAGIVLLVIAAALREVVEQCRVGNMIYCNDILNLADELEAL